MKHKGLQLLDAALTYIEYHPAEWEQESYRCKTGMCVAGHIAVTIAGGELKNHRDPTDDGLVPEKGEFPLGATLISTRAKRLLGDAYVPGMFDAHNSLQTLYGYREIAARQVGEK